MTASRRRTNVGVYVDGQYVPEISVMNVVQVINGRRLNRAVMRFEPFYFRNYSAHQDVRIHEAAVPFRIGQTVRIFRFTQDGFSNNIHRGVIVAVRTEMSPNGEVTIIESRLDHFLVGQEGAPITECSFVEFTDGDWKLGGPVDRDLILNPVLDGRIVPNMFETDDEQTQIEFNPIAVDAVPASYYNSEDFADLPAQVKWWTVSRAIEWLFKTYNDELYVQNPTREELEDQLLRTDTFVRDFRVRRGSFIPQVLDKLLIPLGYSWAYTFPFNSNRARVEFWKRNASGRKWDVRLQRFGQAVNTKSEGQQSIYSEVTQYAIQHDAFNRSANQIQVTGGYKKFEATFELVPGWDPDLDDAKDDLRQLKNDSEEMLLNPELRRAYRYWVLNEAGDYRSYGFHDNRVDGPYADGLQNAYDFSNIIDFGDWNSARRRFMPTITVDPTSGTSVGVHNGIKVEFWDPEGQAWYDASSMPYPITIQVLKKECGITIGGTQLPPIDLFTQFNPKAETPEETFRVRVTATVESDQRIKKLVDKTAWSLTPLPVQQLVELGNKYESLIVDGSSRYAGDPEYGVRQVVSQEDIDEIAEELVASWNVSSSSGKITLESIDTTRFFLGFQITGIQPRNLTLAANNPEIQDLNVIYPTVVAITWDVQNQKTVLDLDIVKDDLRQF